MQHGERAQSQKIHFQETQFLDVLHGILGHHFALVALIERQELTSGSGEITASGMGGSVTHEPSSACAVLMSRHLPPTAVRSPVTWALP